MLIDNGLQAIGYLASHPMYFLQSAKNALGKEITIPKALLQWAIDRRPRGDAQSA